jgi:phosphate transport system permease protein
MSRELVQRLAFALILLATALTVAPIVLVVGYIAYYGLPALSWEFLTAAPRAGMREGGLWPAIVGTLYRAPGCGRGGLPVGIRAR